MNITKSSLKTFRTKFAKAVEDLETELGIKIELGNIRANGSSFRSKIEVNNMGIFVDSIEQQKFENECTKFGFKKSDYKRTVSLNGKTYKFIGFKPRSTKYPVIVENFKGQYKLSVSMAKRNLV